MRGCEVEGCGRQHKGRGLCAAHLYRLNNRGEVGPAGALPRQAPKTCTVDGCEKPKWARDLCQMHYRRWRQYGDPGPAQEMVGRSMRELGRPASNQPCSVDGCDTAANSKGFCSTHYRRWIKSGDPGPAGRLHKIKPLCSVEGCVREAHGKGYCSLHYSRLRINGTVGTSGVRYAPAGSGTVAPNGYRYIQRDGKRIAEHRWVVEQRLGRPLLPSETVHHRNGQRADNRDENLELWSSWQPPGQRVEDKSEWAIEWLAQYKPEALAPEFRPT